MDSIDKKILALLKENSQLSNKEIGLRVHLTGQAVGLRILKLKELGMIRRFTIDTQHAHTQFIRIFMNSNQFTAFEQAVNRFAEVEAFYQTSGQACYLIVAHFSETQLSAFIEVISKWARYSIDSVLVDKTTPSTTES